GYACGLQAVFRRGEAFEQYAVLVAEREVVSDGGEEPLQAAGGPDGCRQQRRPRVARRVGVVADRSRFEQHEQEDCVVSFEKLDEPVHPCLLKWRLPFFRCGRRRKMVPGAFRPGVSFALPAGACHFMRNENWLMFLSAMPVPRTTARIGSSAMLKWMPFLDEKRLSSPLMRAPPPARATL